MNTLPSLRFYQRHEVKELLRKERYRARIDAGVALVFTLLMGWVYAQLAIRMGVQRPWIGIIAVGVQSVTFAFAMWMRPSDAVWRRKAL